MSASTPWLMALRVVSLPATTSRMKNEATSAEVSRSPSTSAWTRLVVEVLGGHRPALVGQRRRIRADVHRHLQELVEVGGQIRVAEPQDHVGPVEDPLMVRFGDAHHVADDLQR